jgi:hypothetical protein
MTDSSGATPTSPSYAAPGAASSPSLARRFSGWSRDLANRYTLQTKIPLTP